MHHQLKRIIDAMPRLARRPESNPLGKMNYQLPKLRLADETGECLAKLASETGMSASECARLLIEAGVHGAGHVKNSALARIERVTRNVS